MKRRDEHPAVRHSFTFVRRCVVWVRVAFVRRCVRFPLFGTFGCSRVIFFLSSRCGLTHTRCRVQAQVSRRPVAGGRWRTSCRASCRRSRSHTPTPFSRTALPAQGDVSSSLAPAEPSGPSHLPAYRRTSSHVQPARRVQETLAMLWAHALGAARPLRPRLINHDSVDDDDRKYFGGTLAAWSSTHTQGALQDEQELKGHLFLRAEARLRRLHEHGRAARRSQERERWCLTADVIVPARPNSVIEF